MVASALGLIVVSIFAYDAAASVRYNPLTPTLGGTTCTATEIPVPAGYIANQLACVNVPLAQGGVGNCTIINTAAGPAAGGSTGGPSGPGNPGQPSSPP